MDAVFMIAIQTMSDEGAGPVVRVDVSESLPHELIDTVLEFVDFYGVVDLAIAWYGQDLEAMIHDRDSIDILDAAGLAAQRQMDHRLAGVAEGTVAIGLTDYEYWASCSEIRDANAVPFAELQAGDLVRPFSELNESPGVMELVFHGSAPLETQPPGVAPRLPWREREAAVAAARDERVRTRVRRKAANVWQHTLEKMRSGLPPDESAPEPYVIGMLNAGLDSILNRDRVILTAVNSSVTDILKVPKRELGKLLGEATEHSANHAWAVIELLEYIASYSDDDDPAAFAVAAYLRWWMRDLPGARMDALFAYASDPQYSLTQLVIRALAVELEPPVVERKDCYPY